jgi:hypothetical protein
MVIYHCTSNQSQFFIRILIFNVYFKPHILKFNIVYLCINFCNISMYVCFVIYFPRNDNMSGRNMWEVYSVYNTLSYIYVNLFV